MRSLSFVLGLASCAVAPELGERQQQIVGGELATTADFPTVVDLELEPGDWFCTGTLVDPEWVLTAAHCVNVDVAAPALHVRFDADNVNSGKAGRVLGIAEINFHPDYNDVDFDNDIAMLRLAEPVTDRAPTPVRRAAPRFGTEVIQVGYGDGNDAGGGFGVLRKLRTTTIDCAAAKDAGIANANTLCFDAEDGSASCYGDSGGPAFLDAGGGALEVVGVVSGGTEDSCIHGIDVFTSVPGELDYVKQFLPIDEVTDDDGGCNTGGGAGGWLALALLGLLAVRKRK
jgi:uncharacterized protein (TIGR03382 family)